MENSFFDVMDVISKMDISDVHIWEDSPIAVRNWLWEIVYLDEELSRDEIFGFTNSIFHHTQIDDFLNGHEIDIAYDHGDVRYRVNVYHDVRWVNLAMRKITATPPSLEEISMPSNLNNLYLKDKWLILVTGPTGSGKSTTLAAIIEYINKTRRCHIITLEDPIEYMYKQDKALITQREVWKSTLSWANGIKYSLRQDPDVIMIWEMRDQETISAALTLVETWHLVLGTLHTVNAMQTITRIIDVFPPHQQSQIAVQLSLTLEAIISQRLIPRKDKKWRVAVREIMLQNTAISNLIREKKVPQMYSVMETQIQSGMVTMDHALAKLVATNQIDINTAASKVKNTSWFVELINYYKTKE